MFHASQLKRCHELPLVITHPQVFHLSRSYCPSHETVLGKILVKRGNEVLRQVLVKWNGIPED